MLLIVASNNELTAKLSGDWLRSRASFGRRVLVSSLRKNVVVAHTTPANNTKPPRIKRKENEGTTSARTVRMTQSATSRVCRVGTSENTDELQIPSVVGAARRRLTGTADE